MPKISEHNQQSKPHEIEQWLVHNVTNTLPYLDSVWLFGRYLPRGFRTAIEANGCSLWVKPCKVNHGSCVGYWVTVHQPTMGALAALDRLDHASLFRFDLATDFLTNTGKDAEWLQQWLATHVLLRWRPKGSMHEEDHGGLYWVKQSHRKRRSPRDLLAYTTLPSKLTGQPCMHLELRFQTAQACHSQGVHRARDLARLNPSQLFERCLRISFASETYVQKTIRDEVQNDIRHYRGKPSDPLDDKLRANVRYEVASILTRAGHDRAQWLKDNYPKRIGTTFSPSILAIPKRLIWCSSTNASISKYALNYPTSKKPNTINASTLQNQTLPTLRLQPNTTSSQ